MHGQSCAEEEVQLVHSVYTLPTTYTLYILSHLRVFMILRHWKEIHVILWHIEVFFITHFQGFWIFIQRAAPQLACNMAVTDQLR